MLVDMVRLAILVSASDCIIQSLLASFMTIWSDLAMISGATSIDSTIDASTTWVMNGSISLLPLARLSSTKPNSPACASARPVRIDTPSLEPNSLASAAIRANFTSTGPIRRISTSHQLSITMRTLSSMPTVMKNSPSSTSRNGLMSSSTWCLYSVSEINMPATNAPSARDSPACSVIHAAPRVIRSRLSMNSSCERRLTTMVNQPRIRRWPTNSSKVNTITAFTPAQARVSASASGRWPSDGIMISSGTTARSWNSRMPMILRPCSLSSSSRSVSILTTMAVDDMASAPPSANAPCQLICKWAGSWLAMSQPNSKVAMMVNATCASPRPNTMPRIASSLGSENSSPIENIRNTTPNSARPWVASLSMAQPSAWGPIRMPTAR